MYSEIKAVFPQVNLHEELKKLEADETPPECFTEQEVYVASTPTVLNTLTTAVLKKDYQGHSC